MFPSGVDGRVGDACGAELADGRKAGPVGFEGVVFGSDGEEGEEQDERDAGNGQVGADTILIDAQKEDQCEGENRQQIAIVYIATEASGDEQDEIGEEKGNDKNKESGPGYGW